MRYAVLVVLALCACAQREDGPVGVVRWWPASDETYVVESFGKDLETPDEVAHVRAVICNVPSATKRRPGAFPPNVTEARGVLRLGREHQVGDTIRFDVATID